MKKHYDGLEVLRIQFDDNGVFAANSTCVAMIQLTLDNGVCSDDEIFWQITWIGSKAPGHR